MKAFSLFGSPGCGKSTEVLRRISALVADGANPNDINFMSFTKAATQEALSRVGLVRSDNFCTIHSLCYRLTRVTHGAVVDIKKLKDFSGRVGVEITGMASDEDDLADGDFYLQVIGKADNQMIGYDEAYENSDRPGSFDEFMTFAESYCNWKKAFCFADFNDMLTRVLGSNIKFKSGYLFIDEAQDLTPLQWKVIDRLIEMAGPEEVHIAGDDDQCQPGDTLVETPAGEAMLSQFRDGDKVLSYNRRGGNFEYRPVKVGVSQYSGQLIEVTIGERVSRYTPNHKCMVVYRHNRNTRVVYLMRKGNKFRVGQTKAFKHNKTGVSLYPVARARQEGADCFWILSSHLDEESAYAMEQFVAVNFGIPQTMFSGAGVGLRTKYESAVWGILKDIDLTDRAIRALQHFGKDILLPHIHHNGGSKHFQCHAINLDPNIHFMATKSGEELVWGGFSVRRTWHQGKIYSLGVDKTGTYIADGIYTHNSIYGWSGADPAGMASFESKYSANRYVLPQSWRIPRVVHSLAHDIISRVPNRVEKEYRPRDEEGTLNSYNGLDSIEATHGTDTLILARTHSVLKKVEEGLREACVPYLKTSGRPGLLQNKYALAIRSWGKIREGANLTKDEFAALRAVLPPARRDSVDGADFKFVFDHEWRNVLEVPYGMLSYYDGVDMAAAPTIRLSTIHGSKGKEADHVVLITELTNRVRESMDSNPDDEHRCFYVGVTRAKHRLDVVEDSEGYQLKEY